MPTCIHELPDWPGFEWNREPIAARLAAVRHRQGRLIGRMEALGVALRDEAALDTLTEEVIKSSEIEGEILDRDQVRSLIASRLGIDIGALTPADRNVEGVVEMMLDATQKYDEPLTDERMFGWHAALFPTGRSGMRRITVGAWRDDKIGPMQVVPGPEGRERVHYEAPAAAKLNAEMELFLEWFNGESDIDPVLKAAIAHLWFVTIHPFDDGNGRIARAIADVALARSEQSPQRFYSMSPQIRKERKAYYDILESTQKGGLDITPWLQWFLDRLDRAFSGAEEILAVVNKKASFWKNHAGQAFNERQRDMVNRLFDGFERKVTSSKWALIEKCSPDTALRDITELVERCVLSKDEAGGRSASYSLASQTSALNRRDAETEQELQKAKLFVADTNHALGYFQAMLAQRKFDFNQASKRILELEEQLERLPREAEARAERATREAEAQVEHATREAEAQIARLTREAEHNRQRLHNFERSTCWRITRPLRVMKLTLAHYGLVSKSSPIRWFR